MKHIFGPVLSRRLGRSLGIDLVPYKICSLNCLYCECGKTPDNQLVIERKPYIPAAEIMESLDKFVETNSNFDYITLTGSGEPTLNSDIGRIISMIKMKYPEYKLALLTNSTMMHDESLREELLPLDLIVPSLDAATGDVFRRINIPHKEIVLSEIINGLVSLKNAFKGLMWLEVFFIPGINDSEEELNALKMAISRINPDRVQLNSLDRPAAFENINKMKEAQLLKIKEFFAPLPAEIIAKYNKDDSTPVENISDTTAADIKELLMRRPMTEADIKDSLGITSEVFKDILAELSDGFDITKREKDGDIYYFINSVF